LAGIEFGKEQKDLIAAQIQRYFEQELDQEIGSFDALFLLDFFSEKIGPYYYNNGLRDAQALFQSSLESVADAIYEIEKPTDSRA